MDGFQVQLPEFMKKQGSFLKVLMPIHPHWKQLHTLMLSVTSRLMKGAPKHERQNGEKEMRLDGQGLIPKQLVMLSPRHWGRHSSQRIDCRRLGNCVSVQGAFREKYCLVGGPFLSYSQALGPKPNVSVYSLIGKSCICR